jgi:hypothetical protein
MDIAIIHANDPDEIARETFGAGTPFWLGISWGGAGWITLDGCMPVLSWAPGAPVNPSIGRCVVQTTQGMMDEDCSAGNLGSDFLLALCATPLPDPACRQLEAHSSYVLASTSSVPQMTAAMMCGAIGMHLVEIDSTAELTHVLQNVAPGLTFWTGATYTGLGYVSPTGCPQVFSWGSGEPSTSVPGWVAYEVDGMHIVGTGYAASVVCESNTM